MDFLEIDIYLKIHAARHTIPVEVHCLYLYIRYICVYYTIPDDLEQGIGPPPKKG